jgi:hypothetical protein
MSSSFIGRLVILGFLWRLLVAVFTVVPSEDGVNYLWMAERFAAGHASAALSEVFPPLMPLLIAPWIWLGADPFPTAQVLLAAAGALAVVPIVHASEAILEGSGRWAGLITVFAHLPVRFAAEVYTEPLFILVGACALWAGAVNRWVLLGLLAGLAFWVRPEAAFLPLGFLLFRPRRAWRALLTFGALVLLLSFWRAALGLGLNISPKLAFNWERTVFATETTATAFFTHLLKLPWLWIEAFSLAGLLAIWGAIRSKEPAKKPILWIWLLVLLLVAVFLPRRRFLVGWMFTIAPLAAMGLATFQPRWRNVLLAIIILLSLVLSLRVTNPNRAAERDLGRHLAAVLHEPDRVTGDMTRVLYFAGQRPLPPRHFTTGELVEMARKPRAARFVVLSTERPTALEVEQRLSPTFARAKLPSTLVGKCADRGILVLERVEHQR